MPRKTKSGRHQLNLAEELKGVLSEYTDELLKQKEVALDKASDFFVDKLEKASPSRTGEFKKNWKRTDKYKGVRYVGNSTVASKNKEYGGDIPLSNILEFSKNGKPFIRATFEQNKDKIIDIIVDEMEKTST